MSESPRIASIRMMPMVVGVIAGGLIAVSGMVENLLVVTVLGGLIGLLIDQHRRIDTLSKQIAHLEQWAMSRNLNEGAQDREDSAPKEAAVPNAEPGPITPPTAAIANLAPPVAEIGAQVANTQTAAARAGPSQSPDPKAAPTEPSAFDRTIESAAKYLSDYFTGGNLIVRVGAIVLLLGVAFMLKYAADNAWLPIELRLAGVAVGGMALLIAGWRLRDKRQGYGLILQGVGIGVLFLTTYSAIGFYHLIPPLFGLSLMVGMTVLAALLAVMQNSQAMAMLALLAGFAAPILASTGSGNYVLLFSYYALLNVGLLTVAWFKAWRLLNLGGFLFTFGIAGAWGALDYQAADYLHVQPFLILFFLQYLCISLLFGLRQPARLRGYVDGTLTFGLAAITFSMQLAITQSFEFGPAFSALGFGLFYLGLGLFLLRSHAGHLRTFSEAFLGLGISFGTLAIPFAFDAAVISAAWAAEGAGLIWLGIKQKRLLPRLAGIGLQAAAGFAWIISYGLYHFSDPTVPFLNQIWINGMIIFAATGIGGYLFHRSRDEQPGWLAPASTCLAIASLASWGFSSIFQIDFLCPADWKLIAILCLLASSGMAYQRLGERLQWALLTHFALGVLPTMIICFALSVADSHSESLDLIGWLPAFAAHLWILHRRDAQPEKSVAPIWHAAGLALFMIVIAYTLWSIVADQAMADDWYYLRVAAFFTAIGFLLHHEQLTQRWPLNKHLASYRELGFAPVLIGYLLILIAVTLAAPLNSHPLPFIPLLNPFDIATGLTLLAVLQLWRSSGRKLCARLNIPSAVAISCFCAGLFVLINGVVLHTLSYYGNITYDAYNLNQSLLVQMTLSLFWTLLGIAGMFWAHRHQSRRTWLVGAGLLAVVVGKLFFVDLSNSGTLERIVSFVGVGLLLLLVGYTSPLPPKQPADIATEDSTE